MNLVENAQILRTFLPSKDYAVSRKFYAEIGFKEGWGSDDLCVFELGTFSFFLQKCYQKEWAENMMMELRFKDLEPYYQFLSSLKLEEKYAGVKIKAPQDYPWGLREVHMIDPAGVCWHFSQVLNK